MSSVIIVILVPVEEKYEKHGWCPPKRQDSEVERKQNRSGKHRFQVTRQQGDPGKIISTLSFSIC